MWNIIMHRRDKIKHILCLCLLAIGMLTCSNPPAHTNPVLNSWLKAAQGIEVRYEHWVSSDKGEDTVIITRFDPSHIHLSVEYQPGKPLALDSWMKQTDALAVINGGYFDVHNRAEALTISHGSVYGTSYSAYGGLLAADAQGTILLRWLHQHPYDPLSDQLTQATESAPMLVVNGQDTHDQFSSDVKRNRRTVVASDRQGRLLFIVSPQPAFTLNDLSQQLAHSDLGLQMALNLDGGASTGLYVKVGTQKIAVNSFVDLPLVIVIK